MIGADTYCMVICKVTSTGIDNKPKTIELLLEGASVHDDAELIPVFVSERHLKGGA